MCTVEDRKAIKIQKHFNNFNKKKFWRLTKSMCPEPHQDLQKQDKPEISSPKWADNKFGQGCTTGQGPKLHSTAQHNKPKLSTSPESISAKNQCPNGHCPKMYPKMSKWNKKTIKPQHHPNNLSGLGADSKPIRDSQHQSAWIRNQLS